MFRAFRLAVRPVSSLTNSNLKCTITSEIELLEWKIDWLKEKQEMLLVEQPMSMPAIEEELDDLKTKLLSSKEYTIKEQTKLIQFWKDKAEALEKLMDPSRIPENVKHWRDLALKAQQKVLDLKLDKIKDEIQTRANRGDMFLHRFIRTLTCLHLPIKFFRCLSKLY